MRLRSVAILSVALVPAVILGACRGQTLDVGSTVVPDAAEPDVTPEAEPAPDVVIELPLGLTIDGISCPAVVPFGTGSNADEWPTWRIFLRGQCDGFGLVSGVIGSRADLAFPQTCSVATSIQFSIPPTTSDAGTIDYIADAVRGSCMLTSGPATATPAAPLVFDATFSFYFDSTRMHHVTYRAAR